jgi:uncharacterized protein (TIGR02145 family)
MKTLFSIILFVLTSTFSFAQTTTLGTQVWSTKNLQVTTFRNGDPIFYAQTDEEWEKAGINGQPAWSYFEHDPKNEATYGKLYNWHAVNDPRGLAPEGWRIPSDGDWNKLIEFLGGKTNASQKMKSTDLWEANASMSGAGDNSSGFSGIPGGYRYGHGGFVNIGKVGYWWSSTESDQNTAWARSLQNYNQSVFRGNYDKVMGLSVRCLKD